MKRTGTYISALIWLAILTLGCKSNKQDTQNTQVKSAETHISFLDASAASEKITVDKSDGFFDFLSLADMSIQLKKSNISSNGGEALTEYKEFLRSEMVDFTDEDKVFMEEVFYSAKSAMDAINPKLYPEKIDLIKTKVNHYGPDVYYTRDEAIVLPENIFEEKDMLTQRNVMLHEIFHILSRYNDEFRDQMYALIGFQKFQESLVLPKEIENVILTNPDGVRRDYAIHLTNDKGELQRALPLIMSRKERYDLSMPTFFSYLNFDLFPLIKIAQNEVTIGINQKGESALSIEHNANFFEQIKDNTTYIIHPDEIMAENFMMAVVAEANGNFDGFSPEGKELLIQVLEILKNFNQ